MPPHPQRFSNGFPSPAKWHILNIESKRGAKPLFYKFSPSPLKERGTKGVR